MQLDRADHGGTLTTGKLLAFTGGVVVENVSPSRAEEISILLNESGATAWVES